MGRTPSGRPVEVDFSSDGEVEEGSLEDDPESNRFPLDLSFQFPRTTEVRGEDPTINTTLSTFPLDLPAWLLYILLVILVCK